VSLLRENAKSPLPSDGLTLYAFEVL